MHAEPDEAGRALRIRQRRARTLAGLRPLEREMVLAEAREWARHARREAAELDRLERERVIDAEREGVDRAARVMRQTFNRQESA